jgi:ankyrin repeat protein
MNISGIPGGFEDSNSDSEDEFFFTSKVKPKPMVIEKTPIQLKKERLLTFVTENNLSAIKDELDGPVKGYDIDQLLDARWNLLYHACFLGHCEIVKYLVEVRGACINMTENSETPLMVACYSNADSEKVLEVVKALINESTIISSSNECGITPLMFASRNGHLEVVKYLISLKDAVDAIDNNGKNALFHAIDGKQVEIAKFLIDSGIDLSVTENFGNTAKNYANDELQMAIYELFAPDVYEYLTPCNFLSYNQFEDIVLNPSSEV